MKLNIVRADNALDDVAFHDVAIAPGGSKNLAARRLRL